MILKQCHSQMRQFSTPLVFTVFWSVPPFFSKTVGAEGEGGTAAAGVRSYL